MPERSDEDQQLRSAALQNAQSILAARQRMERELVQAKAALEKKTVQLEHTLSMMRATLQSTTDGLLVTEENGSVTDFNETFVRTWQLPPQVMATRNHREIMRAISQRFKDPDEFLARVAEIYDTSPPETFDTLELADGRVFERFSKLQVVGEHHVGRVWSIRDVTDRRTAEREHAYLASIITSSTDGIVSKTLEGIVTSWNPAAERIFGYKASEMVGQPILMIIPPDRTGEESTFLAKLRRGERIENLQTIRRTKDGRLIHVSLTISPVRDSSGRIVGVSKIVRDVTEREQLLEREQSARARAEEANRLKDEFLATVSHEIRTPLAAILGWSQLLRSGQLSAEKAQHAAEVVERNAKAQAQVIEDLLDVSRIITGNMRLEVQAFMPSDSIEAALESVKPMAMAKGVDLRSVLDPKAGPISGDRGRLQQVIWNLLTNAIKFTPKDGRVEIRLERINSHLEIAVSDTGQGLSPEFIPHAFDRFRQADSSSSRTTGGLGLGLAIVRHLVELHGGAVSANSAGEGQGATFIVRLPLRAVHGKLETKEQRVSPNTDRTSPSGSLPDLQGVRALIVDDEPDARELLHEVLEQCGAEVRDAGSATQAFDMVMEWRPDVLISDIGMPGEDGYALIRRIREWEKTAGTWIPAVALTAYARSEDRMRTLMSGYQVHAAKPIQPLEFALIVAGVLPKHRAP